MPERIQFVVWGEPVPQGSWVAFLSRNPGFRRQAFAKPSNERQLKAWRARVAEAATTAMAGRPALDDDVRVLFVAALPLKGAHPGSRFWRYPSRNTDGDADKLERALLDGLTGPVLTNDARVVDLQIRKRYEGRPDSLPRPGVRIVVEPMEPAALDI